MGHGVYIPKRAEVPVQREVEVVGVVETESALEVVEFLLLLTPPKTKMSEIVSVLSPDDGSEPRVDG